MKKLVIITDNFLPRRDGISRFLSEIIPRIKSVYDIHIICPNYGEIKGYEYCTITKMPLSKKTYGDIIPAKIQIRKMYSLIKKADIVFSQTIGPIGGIGLFLAQVLKKKTISFVHSVEWELFSKATTNTFIKKFGPVWTKRLVRFLYGRCSELIVPSQRIAEMLLWQGVKKQKTVIHLGVDTNKFKKRNASILRRKLGIKTTDIVIGYHGRIAREKDIPTLLRAYVKLRKQYSRVKLLIVGDGVAKLIDQIKKQPGVIYVPALNDVQIYLNAMDIYCLSSLTETTSLSTLEAMSSELPVISSAVGFVKDYLIEGTNGYFFKSGNSFDLMQKLELLIRNIPLSKKMGARGRALVVKNFNWDETSKEILMFFATHSKNN